MADQTSGQVSLPNGGQITDVNNPEPNEMAQQLSAARTVPAAPITPPATPTEAQPQPADRDHLMGRMVGKLMSGLQGQHTEYTIGPNGETVPQTVKEKPGSVFKSIVAYGLLGGQGIGPKEGEQTFAQGLLAGLGGGMRTARTEQEKADQLRRQQAQQDFANRQKADEAQRQNKELEMKQKLNDAAIANYTGEKVMRDYQLMMMHQENQLGGVKQLVARDAPMLQTFQAAGMKPIHEGLNAQEFQKLLADNTNDINAHKVIPIVTGYEPHNNSDGSITWEPVGALYPPGTKYTADTLSQLKDAGYKESDPLYKDVALKIKNGSSVDPREFLTTYREIGQHFDYAKNRSEIAKNDAIIAHERAETAEAGVRTQMAKLGLEQQQSAQLGKELFNHIGTDQGFTRPGSKDKIMIPATQDGGYDFTQLSDKEKTGLRDYMTALQDNAQTNLDKLITASKANPDDKDILSRITQESESLSVFNNMANSLNGTRKPVQLRPATQTKLDQIAESYANKLTGDAQTTFKALVGKGYGEADAQRFLQGVPLPPDEKIAVSRNLTQYFAEANPLISSRANEVQKANATVANAQADAAIRSNPILKTMATAGSATLPPSGVPTTVAP